MKVEIKTNPVKDALTEATKGLDTVIKDISIASDQQIRTAIKDLAQNQKRIIELISRM